MRRFSGRFRSALIIGLQGIRARKLRTLLSMVSLFLGVLAVVVVQAGASIAERAMLANVELTQGIDGTKYVYLPGDPRAVEAALETVRGRTDAAAMVGMSAIIGEPGVRPVNEGAAPFDENWGPNQICHPDGTCEPENGDPPGQAVEVRLIALTGDVRAFRPYRQKSGEWLDFTTMPAMAPRLVVNLEAVKGLQRHSVPAEMRVRGATANLTPSIVGVVDDGDYQPRAYVRMDELATWLPGGVATGEDMTVVMAGSTPVEQVLASRLQAVGQSTPIETVDSRGQQVNELRLVRLIFLAMAGLVLLIGVAGILNVGLATVGERVEEFALRRAVGTPRSLLAGIVLAETLFTGLFTAAAAIGVSVAGLKALSVVLGGSDPFLRDLAFPWDAGIAGIVAGLIAGVLGGFIPALRAAGIPIASVMRA